MTATYDLISMQTTSSVVTSVTFNSIPSTYRDLVIIADVAAQAFDSWLGLRFNGDTANNYQWVRAGSGGAVTSAGSGAQIQLYAHLTTTKGNWTTNVLDYAVTDKQKTVLGKGGSGGSFGPGITAGRWASTNSITSVTLFGGQGLEFASGATFAIYGIVS